MGVPPSVIKIDKDGVKYISNCDRVQYTMHELIRAALRDTGKFICRKAKDDIKAIGIRKITGRMLKSIQYWVRHKQKTPNLQVGIKPLAWYLGYYETGTSKHPKYGFLQNATKNNIAEIIKIQSQYLSALEDEAMALSLIQESEMMGDDTSEN